MTELIQHKPSQNLRLVLLCISSALSLAACSSSSGSATTGGGGQNNGDASSLQIITPKIVYSKSSTDSTGYVLIKNPTESAVSNLHYSLTQAVGSGSAVTLEPSSATNCASVAAHSQCSIKLLVPTGSIAGSIGFSADNKSSQNKQTQAATGTVSSIGIEQAAYNNSISGADGITLSYYHTVIAGLPYIMVSGLVASSKAGSFNNIVLTDNNANPLPNQELISGSISSAQGSTFNILLPVPSSSGASQIIRVQTQQVASDGSVKVVSTSSNSSTLSTSTKIGIADMLPSAVYLTSTHPEQVVTFANTGDVNAELQALVASSSNIEVSFTPTTIGSGTTTTATLKLKNSAVTASGGSITLSYNDGQEEVKNSAAVGENINLAPSPTPTPTPSPKPAPATPGLSTSLSPDNDFFTTTAIGTVSRTMTIHNSGNTPETNFVFTLPNNNFSIASSGNTADDCTVNSGTKTVTNSLSSGGECNLTVIYTKNSATNLANGDISIAYNYNSSTPAPVPATQSVNYKVTQSRAILNLSPTSVTYANIVNNSLDSSPAILTLTNTGDLPARNLSRTINPNPSSLFTITGASTNCGNGNTLPAGESCTITTQFGPASSTVTNATATLTISNIAVGGSDSATSTLIGTVLSAQSANISQGVFSGTNFAGGTGADVPNSFQIEQSSTTFPSVSVTLTNSGSVPATNFYIGEISPNSNWTLGGNCGTSVSKISLAASGGSCTVTFTMTAAAVTNSGAQNLALTNYSLTWNDQAHPVTSTTQALTGTAYVNVYAPASIAVTTSPASNISIAPGENFTMTATLSGGYQVAAQTIHATTTNADISFTNNDCALNSQNNYSCTISAVAASDAAAASNQTVTLNNTTTPSMAPSPSTITFAITAPAPVVGTISLPQTGQTPTAPLTATVGMDGFTYIGVPWAYVTSGSTTPATRFTVGIAAEADCITDNLTGLMWVKDLNTVVIKNQAAGSLTSWQNALDSVSDINSGAGLCGHTDWYLPTVNDLSSLLNDGYIGGTNKYQSEWLISQGFSNVQANNYWLSSTFALDTSGAWYVNFRDGSVSAAFKISGSFYVWPVRGGQ